MSKPDKDKATFLLAEYEFMQKCFELQFNHFMAVFYFWIAVITTPISASLISNLGAPDSVKPFIYGILCILLALVGFFLSIKMFDIRHSQLGYAKKLNEIRDYFWRNYEFLTKDELLPFGMKKDGKWVDPFQKARTDFGQKMAFTMSLAHGISVAIGLSLLLTYLQSGCGFCNQTAFFRSAFLLES